MVPALYAFVLHTADPLSGETHSCTARAECLASDLLASAPHEIQLRALLPSVHLPFTCRHTLSISFIVCRLMLTYNHVRVGLFVCRRQEGRAARRAGCGHGRGAGRQLPGKGPELLRNCRRRAAAAQLARQAAGTVCKARSATPHRPLRLKRCAHHAAVALGRAVLLCAELCCAARPCCFARAVQQLLCLVALSAACCLPQQLSLSSALAALVPLAVHRCLLLDA